ncbi:MAG: hypothetical protein ABEI98_01295 [Halorhabdus sp.]
MDIDFDATDLAMFVYNVAVVMTGGYVAIRFDIDDLIVMAGFAVAAGFVWTVYYHFSMVDRLQGIRSGDIYTDDRDDIVDEEARVDRNEQDEEDDQRGVEAPWE